MEMGFAPSGLATKSASALLEAACAPLDWHVLKARFVAAHALRRELAMTADLRFAAGGFVDSGADALAALRERSSVVNLTASGNGKSLSAIVANVTDTPTSMTEENYD